MLAITGVIPMTDTIFLWQSMVLALILIIVSVIVCWVSAPTGGHAVTAEMMGVDLRDVAASDLNTRPTRPAEWIEYSPILTILVVALGGLWIVQEFAGKNPFLALSNLNTYNLVLFMLALLLHWRPRSFLQAVSKAVHVTAGVLTQFPFYAGVAAILTTVVGFGGHTLSDVSPSSLSAYQRLTASPL